MIIVKPIYVKKGHLHHIFAILALYTTNGPEKFKEYEQNSSLLQRCDARRRAIVFRILLLTMFKK